MKAKLILSCLLAAGLASSARAQLFDSQTAGNVLLGGIAGAIIGDNNHHQAAAGAAIGATAGLLWSLATVPTDQRVTVAPPPFIYAQPRVVTVVPRRSVVVVPACPLPPVVCVPAHPVRARVVVVAPGHGSHRRVVVISRHRSRDRD